SATHEAIGSARVVGTCLATGEAVGVAAARLADGGGWVVNLAELVEASARTHARRPALTDVRSGPRPPYIHLARQTDPLAGFLVRQGVGPGQRIALLAPNGTAYLPAAFGLLATGACLVPVAASHTPAEIAHVVRDVEVNGCLAWPRAEPLPGWAE